MSSQISSTLIMCIIFGLVSLYYFNKFQDSEKEFNKLHRRFEQTHMENQKMRTRVKDLQSYKNDVSKTMKILDNELVLINDHLHKNNNDSRPIRQRQEQSQQSTSQQSFVSQPFVSQQPFVSHISNTMHYSMPASYQSPLFLLLDLL